LGWKQQAVGAFALFHMTAVVLITLPRAMVSERELRRGGVQEWFDDATVRLRDYGIETTKDEFIEWAVVWGGRYNAARDGVQGALRPYVAVTGAKQSWRMFSGVEEDPAVLEIAVMSPGESYQVVYRTDDRSSWNADLFDNIRFRTVLNGGSKDEMRATYKRFSRWVEEPLHFDFPNATKYRVMYRKRPTPSPADWPESGLPKTTRRYRAKIHDFKTGPVEAAP